MCAIQVNVKKVNLSKDLQRALSILEALFKNFPDDAALYIGLLCVGFIPMTTLVWSRLEASPSSPHSHHHSQVHWAGTHSCN